MWKKVAGRLLGRIGDKRVGVLFSVNKIEGSFEWQESNRVIDA